MKNFLLLLLCALTTGTMLRAQVPNPDYDTGIFYFDAEDYPQAILHFEAGLRQAPDSERILFNLALAQYELHRYAEMARTLRTLTALAPDDADAWQLLGSAYDGMEAYFYAADAFSQAYLLQPTANTQLLRGAVYVKAGEYDLAAADYTAVLEAYPDDALAHAGMGDVYLATDQFASAIDAYDRAILLDPSDALTFHNRGLAKVEIGWHETALYDFSSAIELDPYVDAYYANRALCRLEIQDRYGADIDARKARRYNPENADAWFALGRIATLNQDYYAAADGFNMALEIQQDEAEYYYERGKVYHAIEAFPGAVEDFRIASSLDPELAEIDKWLARSESAQLYVAPTSRMSPEVLVEEPYTSEQAPTPASRVPTAPAERTSEAIDGWMLQPDEE